MCDFESEPAHSPWVREQGASSAITGPPSDHSSGGGFYLLADATQLTTGDDIVALSPKFEDNTANGTAVPGCFEFYLYMVGSGMGSFAVEMVDENGAKDVLYQVNGPQKAKWHQIMIDLPAGKTGRLRFVSTVGSNPLASNIALDDMYVHEGACDPTYPSPTLLSCGFENGFCDWTSHATGGRTGWQKASSGTPTLRTGPSGPATVSRGRFDISKQQV